MRFIIIVSDTFRRDNLTTLPTRTPELDALADRAVFFENAYLGSFPTIPNRYDMMTGRYRYPFGGWAPLLPDDRPLAQVLQENGYITQLIADTPHMMRNQFDYSRGFIGFDWTRGQEIDIPFTWMNHPINRRMSHEKTRMAPLFRGEPLANVSGWTNRRWDGELDTFPAQTCSKACHWLEHNYLEENFLLWIDLFDPHEPWDPPEYLVKRYDPDYTGEPMIHPNYGPAAAYTEAELKNLAAHYFAEAELVSKWVGMVLRKIEEVGIYEDTCIIFTTDHGIYLGEHNWTGKANKTTYNEHGQWRLYNEICHIPLIIKPPQNNEQRQIGEFVQPVDIFPTIAEMAGVKDAPISHGTSLMPMLAGGDSPASREFVVSSHALAADNEEMQWTTIRDRSHALHIGGRQQDPPELYDLVKDPGETENIIQSNTDIASRLGNTLIDHLNSLGADKVKISLLADKI